MCGIAGYFGTQNLNESSIKNCLNKMRRRGPDSASIFTHTNKYGNTVYLLHSRLNIIDLDDRANQPFHMGNHVLAFNGELYNYLELKAENEKNNFEYQTLSDTEVLIHTLIRDGVSGLDKCEGMWAYALYDKNEGTLQLSRDRFGEKPLYTYTDSTGVYFGSEVKFIFELLNRKLPLNYNHLNRFLINGYKSLYKTKETFFEGLKEVDAASVLKISETGNQHTEKYWKPSFQQNDDLSYSEAVKGAKEALIKSIKLRLRADVPLAFCMSGGVDSNSLISIAKNIFNYDVHGFTITNTDARYEEQDMIDYAVKELGVKHTSIKLDTKDFIPRLKELIKQHDAPVYTITYYTHWLLMESIKKHGYRISISGTAADEIYTGYYDHQLAYLYEIYNTPEYEQSLANWKTYIKPIVRNPFLQDPEAFIKNPNMRDHIYLDSHEFSSFLCKPWEEEFKEKKITHDLLRNRMLNEIFCETTPVILHEDDLNAMYYSIENRSPFLDRSLFEFCHTIPSKYLIRDGMAKAILRDSMKGIVPEKIITNRRKVGFNAPIFDLLDVKNPEARSYLLDDSPVFDFIKKDKVENLIKNSDLGNSKSKFLFNILNTKIFIESFS
ncbi:MAG: asparagine synthase (glutamine-hydrolyzing) [Oligoflexia bacterium]|nr:asparagine synthase (glutamine-hydrolyzing) [Oligoflexia bacterium]